MNRKTVLFLDNTYPKAYQSSTLQEQAIGGTEASVVKTAQILSQQLNVIVAQKYRIENCVESEHLQFIPKFDIKSTSPDFIIILRKFPLVKEMRKQFPKAQIFLWLHTYKNLEYAFKKHTLAKTNCHIICNSKTHQQDTNRLLNDTWLSKIIGMTAKKIPVHFCYNPVSAPNLKPIDRNINKLLFFSSPNKGLEQVIKCFEYLRQSMPKLRLYIANPGYKKSNNKSLNPQISILGSLPHEQMMQHVAESLCVFYPQNTFAETFGLIYAEANAYRTPVLAHDIGSAREILHPNNPLIDANNYQEIAQTIENWQKNLPEVSYNPQFNDDFILNQWLGLLT